MREQPLPSGIYLGPCPDSPWEIWLNTNAPCFSLREKKDYDISPANSREVASMEGVAALGLICNVLQVSGYAHQIVAKGREIRASVDGALNENRDSGVCAKELLLRNTRLAETLETSKKAKECDEDDDALLYLGTECNNIAKDLAEKLSDLRVSETDSKRKSVRAALKASWSKEKIDSIADRMRLFQDQMNSRMLQSINLRQRLMAVEQSNQFTWLNQSERRVLANLKDLQLLLSSQLDTQTGYLQRILETH